MHQPPNLRVAGLFAMGLPCTPRQVDVDASILDINTMYDREKLVEFIHGLV